MRRYEDANQSILKREQKITKIINHLEKNMEFIGITGVEDLL